MKGLLLAALLLAPIADAQAAPGSAAFLLESLGFRLPDAPSTPQGAPVAAPQDPTELENAMASAMGKGRFLQAVRLFEAAPRGAPTPAAYYLLGYSLMSLNLPEKARPHFEAAAKAGFKPWEGWPAIDAQIERIDAVARLSPPRLAVAPPQPRLEVFARRTAWSGPVLDAIPSFMAVGELCYGNLLPSFRLFLFTTAKVYTAFYEALFGSKLATSWAYGSANINAAVFSEEDDKGPISPPGDPEIVGNVLHEFQHAWYLGYITERSGSQLSDSRRPWLDEGLADYAAGLRDPSYLESRRAWIAGRVAEGAPRPDFSKMQDSSDFYEEASAPMHYWLSALLLSELMGPAPEGPRKLRKILDLLPSEDAAAAVKEATGKDPAFVFASLVHEFWENKDHAGTYINFAPPAPRRVWRGCSHFKK